MKSLKELNEKYDLELDKIISEIKKSKVKLVLLQFPDGLKPYATVIADYLEKKTALKSVPRNISQEMFTKGKGVEFLIWLGDCFGACDVPVLPKEIEKEVDLVVQFGHNETMPSF